MESGGQLARVIKISVSGGMDEKIIKLQVTMDILKK